MSLLAYYLSQKNCVISQEQEEQFQHYYDLLIAWNKKMNLTSLTEQNEVMIKHFYDSLTPSFFVDFNEKESLCDVGSGAGFPGVPLKILFPSLRLTIVDSLNKRLTFLQEVIRELRLTDVFLYHDRVETFAHRPQFRASFDWVTARAVAQLSVLSEYCLPLVKSGGTFIALKGNHFEDELEAAEAAISRLGGRVRKQHTLTLPDNNGERSIILIEKIKESPKKYPRNPGLPSKKPLH